MQVPETSREAFQSLDPEKLTETKRKILYALSQLISATTEEVAAYLKVDHEKCWKRFSELRKEGLIFRPGTKKALRSGRAGYCWTLTGKSMPTTTASEKALKGPCIADYSRKINAIAKCVPPTLF